MSALRYLRENTAPTAPVPLFQTFVAVAKDEGKGPTEYGRTLRIRAGTVSKYLLILADRKARQRGLIAGERSPKNFRQKEYRLTRRGERLAQDLLACLDG